MLMEEETEYIQVCCCYAHKDKPLLDELVNHLEALVREKLIKVWHDRDIGPGQEWHREIGKALENAQIILLLISSDFIKSDYCYSVEMAQAIERHSSDKAQVRVIPVILRPCVWESLPFGKLQALPEGVKPITNWENPENAYVDITNKIKNIAKELAAREVESITEEPAAREVEKPKVTRRALLIGGILVAGVGGLGFWELKSRETSVHADPLPLLSGLVISIPGSIYSVAASPNGKQIAATSSKGAVYICDAVTGRLLLKYPQQASTISVNHVSWSPDGQYIASGDDKHQVHVWEAVTGITRFIYSGHIDHVLDVAWSPNGKRIASTGADYDGTVQLWDAFTGNHKVVYSGHGPHPVFALAWSPDGQRVVSGGSDNAVQVWNATSGLLYYTLPHPNIVNTVSWSPHGQWIASGCNDYFVRSWPASNRPENPDVYSGHTSWVRAVAWSPDSQRIASGSYDQTIRIWDTHTKKTLYMSMANPTEGGIDAVAWLPNGKRIVAGTEGDAAQIWNITAPQ